MPTPITNVDLERIAARERSEALLDLRAMLDQHRTLIARGGYRTHEQIKMLKRRQAALEYAIGCIEEQPVRRPGNPSETVKW